MSRKNEMNRHLVAAKWIYMAMFMTLVGIGESKPMLQASKLLRRQQEGGSVTPKVITADLSYTMTSPLSTSAQTLAVSLAANDNESSSSLPSTSMVKQIAQSDLARARVKVGQQRQHILKTASLESVLATTTTTSASGDGGDDTEVTVSANNVVVSYLTRIAVGSGQTYDLIIDTGSSNTWVGVSTPYTPSSSTKSTGNAFAVSYGSGQVQGIEVIDTISVASNVAAQQSIGVAQKSSGFSGVDGILGVGPTDLTQSSTTSGQLIPTIIDSLFQENVIPEPLLGVSFVPTSSDSANNGRITFGGVDESSFTGSLAWIPRTTTAPASHFWGVDVTFSSGTTSLSSTTLPGIVDTGTTLIMLPDDVFAIYLDNLPNARVDSQVTGLIEIDADDLTNVPNFVVNFGTVFAASLTPEQQFFTSDQNKVLGLPANKRFGYMASMGTPSGQGLDFILGQKFLENFYTAFASVNGSVGIATSSRPLSNSNDTLSGTLTPSTSKSNTSNFANPPSSSSADTGADSTTTTGSGSGSGSGSDGVSRSQHDGASETKSSKGTSTLKCWSWTFTLTWSIILLFITPRI